MNGCCQLPGESMGMEDAKVGTVTFSFMQENFRSSRSTGSFALGDGEVREARFPKTGMPGRV